MAFRNRGRKRVSIQSGHQERIIERRSSRPRQQRGVKQTSRRAAPPKRRARKMRSAVRRSKDLHWNCKTHRPTVAQVVYQFLERASTKGANKSQKTNATNQFRQLQRRKRLRPDVPKRLKPKREAMDDAMPVKEEYRFPYSKLPTEEAEKSIEKCIYEVLSFGTMLGLLVPADREGMMFRVSSDVGLFKTEGKREHHQRKADFPDGKLLEDMHCECENKCR